MVKILCDQTYIYYALLDVRGSGGQTEHNWFSKGLMHGGYALCTMVHYGGYETMIVDMPYANEFLYQKF
jgi:hypothetical protein